MIKHGWFKIIAIKDRRPSVIYLIFLTRAGHGFRTGKNSLAIFGRSGDPVEGYNLDAFYW